MQRRADANLGVLEAWVAKTAWVDFLAEDPAIRSNTSVCLKVVDPRVTGLSDDAQADFAKKLAGAAGEGRRGPRRRRLPRRPSGPAHLVRRHGRHLRPRGADALARLGLRRPSPPNCSPPDPPRQPGRPPADPGLDARTPASRVRRSAG